MSFISEFFEGIAQITVCMRISICYRFHSWFLLNSSNQFPPPQTRPKILLPAQVPHITESTQGWSCRQSSLSRLVETTEYIYCRGREEIGRAYTTTLLVMVDRVKGRGHAPPPSPGWADFAIMMECTTQESGRCHSVCTLWLEL
jgi:hypothetical protein